jgi:hypothetical protein
MVYVSEPGGILRRGRVSRYVYQNQGVLSQWEMVRYVFMILGVYSAKDEVVRSSEPMGEAACVSEPEKYSKKRGIFY